MWWKTDKKIVAQSWKMRNNSNVKRMWRNWQTRMIQVHVGDHAGSSPVIRTKKGKATICLSFFGAFANEYRIDVKSILVEFCFLLCYNNKNGGDGIQTLSNIHLVDKDICLTSIINWLEFSLVNLLLKLQTC